MDSAKCLKDHETRILNEIIQTRNKEKVVKEYISAFPQLLLSSFEIKVYIQVFNEGGDRVPIGIGFFLYDLN